MDKIRMTLITAVMLLSFLSFATVVRAQVNPSAERDAGQNFNPTQGICEQGASNVADSSLCFGANDARENEKSPILGEDSLAYRVVSLLSIIIGAISVIMIVVSGFRYVVSGGDQNGTKSAKDTILYAVIGLMIAIFAQTLIRLIITRGIF